MKKKNNLFESILHGVFLLLGLVTIGCVLLITIYLIISGIPAIREIGLIPFLFGNTWASTAIHPQHGILPFILTSIYGTAGAIVIGVPIGFLTAVYLAKMASPKVKGVMGQAVSMLAGIPSVVYGLVGMMVLVPGIRKLFNVPDGASLLASMIVLAIMILPSIIKMSVTALEAVPKEYEDASLALGATPEETWFHVSVPAAKSGIAAAAVLGVGRAIGEAMAVMMVAGNSANMPDSFALDRGHGSAVLELDGRAYRFDMSSIQSNGNLLGAVILAVDVTESQNAEQMRREFSANVSHELKTPLQGIIGSAELLESGMVKQEDTPRFVGHIRKEASRLVNLIEDIIRLSQLDEGVELPAEQVEMLQLAEDVREILTPSAADQQVSVRVTGRGFTVMGVRRMLQEIIYNLCDNAIKYNLPGGNVTICAENDRLVVSDTGIGIPAEHKDRIFERFYRVDKSHSKASGGTGLGLSIVKHAAAYHKAEINLDSTPGKGTTITIQF